MEEWKPVEGYEGYEVSSMGRVRSLTRPCLCRKGDVKYIRIRKGVILSQGIKGNGYRQVVIGHRFNNAYVHRLVASAFVPNPNNYPEIDHINADRGDNRACNLRWVTRSMNNLNPHWNEARKRNRLKKYDKDILHD